MTFKITLQKVRKVITTIKEIDIQIAFSSVIDRDDQDFEEEIKEINRNLENLSKGLSSLIIIIILMVHALIEANYT